MSQIIQSDIKSHEYWMQLALEQAEIAASKQEVPVGAVIVKNNKLIASGHNYSINCTDPTMHAEIAAIRGAGIRINNYRLIDCDLYVTLEPCMMCLGAIVHSRIKSLYYGAKDHKTGVLGGKIDLSDVYKTNHSININSGILADKCSALLTNFFKAKREKNI